MGTVLEEGCGKLGLPVDSAKLAALDSYIDSVMEFNQGYNLMKAESRDELAVNHVLDSLAPYSHLAHIMEEISAKKIAAKEDSSIFIADIGSGGGCPGVPLAVLFPDQDFTLVERMEKRCVFLEGTVRRMGLKNVKVLCTQAVNVPDESFDLEVFRAFHPFDKQTATLLLRMLKKDGVMAAYKARSEKIQAEMDSIRFLIPSYTKIPLSVPFLEDHERNLVVVRKNPN